MTENFIAVLEYIVTEVEKVQTTNPAQKSAKLQIIQSIENLLDNEAPATPRGFIKLEPLR